LPPFNDLVHAFRRLFRGRLVNFLLFGAEIETNDEICPRRKISPFGTYSLVFVNRRLRRLRRVVSVNVNVVRLPNVDETNCRCVDVDNEQVPTHSCSPSPNGWDPGTEAN
jgi:hypothetical protein